MAIINLLANLSLNQGQLLQAVIHNSNGPPTFLPSGGQIYYDTTSGSIIYYDGVNTRWVSVNPYDQNIYWSNIVGGTNLDQVFYIASGMLPSGDGFIDANRFYGSGSIPVAKGGTGTSGFINNYLIVGTDDGIISSSGLKYASGTLGFETASTLGRNYIHIPAGGTGIAPIKFNAGPLLAQNLSNYLGSLEFSVSGLSYISSAGDRRFITYQQQDISGLFSGILPVNQGGTNTSGFTNNSFIQSSGSTLIDFVPDTSGQIIVCDGNTFLFMPLSNVIGPFLKLNPSGYDESTINVSGSSVYINDSLLSSGDYAFQVGSGLFVYSQANAIAIKDTIFFGGESTSNYTRPYINAQGSAVSGTFGGVLYLGHTSGYNGGVVDVRGNEGPGGQLLAAGGATNASGGLLDVSARNGVNGGNIRLFSLGTNIPGNISSYGNVGGRGGNVELNAGTSTSSRGGDILLNAGSANATRAGDINLCGGIAANASGGLIAMYGNQSPAGQILMFGGSAASTRGGVLQTLGGSSPSARGGDIATFGGSYPGGDIITADGGGTIDTANGYIELGKSITGNSKGTIHKPRKISPTNVDCYLNDNEGTLMVDTNPLGAGNFYLGSGNQLIRFQGDSITGIMTFILPRKIEGSGTLALKNDISISGCVDTSGIINVISGNVLGFDGNYWVPTIDATGAGGGGGGTPGGNAGELQYNNAGSFAGVSGTIVSNSGIYYPREQRILFQGLTNTNTQPMQIHEESASGVGFYLTNNELGLSLRGAVSPTFRIYTSGPYEIVQFSPDIVAFSGTQPAQCYTDFRLQNNTMLDQRDLINSHKLGFPTGILFYDAHQILLPTGIGSSGQALFSLGVDGFTQWGDVSTSDTLAGLSASSGDYAVYDGSSWNATPAVGSIRFAISNRSGTSQAISHASFTRVSGLFDTVDIDTTNGLYQGAKFYADRDMTMQFGASLTYHELANNTALLALIYITGAMYGTLGRATAGGAAAGIGAGVGGSLIVPMVSGDYAELYTWHNAGLAHSLTGSSVSGYCHFWGYNIN